MKMIQPLELSGHGHEEVNVLHHDGRHEVAVYSNVDLVAG